MSNTLNLSAVWTPLQREVWSPGMVPTRSKNIYDSERCNVIHPNSFSHILSYTEFAKLSNHQFAPFISYTCCFDKKKKKKCCYNGLIKSGDFVICLKISTWSNSDVVHAVRGHFKYRILLYPTLK